MKKKILLLFCVVCLSGCSMFMREEENQDTQVEETEKEEVVDSNDSLENMFVHFDAQQIPYAEKTIIEEINFAAKEGYSFMYENEYIYLYHLDPSDEAMQQVLQEAESDGTLSAEQNGELKNYNALVNGNFIMMYDGETQFESLEKSFTQYKMQ